MALAGFTRAHTSAVTHCGVLFSLPVDSYVYVAAPSSHKGSCRRHPDPVFSFKQQYTICTHPQSPLHVTSHTRVVTAAWCPSGLAGAKRLAWYQLSKWEWRVGTLNLRGLSSQFSSSQSGTAALTVLDRVDQSSRLGCVSLFSLPAHAAEKALTADVR